MDNKSPKSQDPLHDELLNRELEKENEAELRAAARTVTVAEYYEDGDDAKHVYLKGEYYVNVTRLYHELAVKVENGDLSPEELPVYCWGCKPCRMSENDADDMIRCSTEDMHEGAIDEICPLSIKTLKQALKDFYLHNYHVWSWGCDRQIVVLLDRNDFKRSPEIEEEDKEDQEEEEDD